MNVGRVAAVEFENGPYCRTHLLALHIGGITGHTQSAESDKGRDDCVVSTGATRLFFVRHGADHIGRVVTVNQVGQIRTPCDNCVANTRTHGVSHEHI